MEQFISVSSDLYILKEDVQKMREGAAATGYITVNECVKDKYELVNKHSFQPVIKDKDVLDNNSFNVVFILK